MHPKRFEIIRDFIHELANDPNSNNWNYSYIGEFFVSNLNSFIELVDEHEKLAPKVVKIVSEASFVEEDEHSKNNLKLG